MGKQHHGRRSHPGSPPQNATERRVFHSPDEEGAQELDYWQPERLTLRKGILALSWPMRLAYVALLVATAALNLYAQPRLPVEFSILQWFGYSSFMVNSTFYLIFTFCLMLFLVYRDVINRSVSRRKLFIPLIFCLGNYYLLTDQLLSIAV